MNRVTCISSVVASLLLCVVARAQDWTHYGLGPSRVAARTLAFDAGGSIGAPVWTRSTGPTGQAIEFIGQAGVVQSGNRVVALGWVGGVFSCIAFDAGSGAAQWATPVPAPFVDSWSSPAIDQGNGTVIVASGQKVTALSLAGGAQVWQATLQRQITNASPLVTSSLGSGDRVFITEFAFGGQVGRLYCINADPFNASMNPYQPGAIVWSVGVGEMSGASPTLAGGNVVVATSTGHILAYPANASAPPEPAWDSPNPGGLGLFSGVAAREDAVYAASYHFYGGVTSSNLVKLDAATGQVLWSVPSNRTDALPIPLTDGRVLLSCGLSGFGTHPSLQLFEDNGTSATMLWDTWLDAGPSVGYWTHTPVVIESLMGMYALASAPPPGDPFGPAPSAMLLDLSKVPSDPGFVVETLAGVGITAIGPGGRAFGVGSSGLRMYQVPVEACAGDFNHDGVVDFFDVTEFLAAYSSGDPSADLTGDGTINFFDLQLFLTFFGLGCG